MKLKKFINECRENEVFKNLSIFIVSSWVFLQVVALVAEPLGLPENILTYLLIFLLLGFPLYIYLLWYYQLKYTVKKKPLLDDTGNPIPGKYAQSPFQKIYFSSLSIITIISVGVALVVIDKKFVGEQRLPEIEAGDKIAVLQFDNNTGEENFNIAGKMASDWIIHGITQNKLGQVISPEIIEDYSEVLQASILSPEDRNSAVTEYLQPSKIIEGEYYLYKGKLLFQCSITDEIMNTTLISFEPVECDRSSPLDCIEALKQRILGYLVTEAGDMVSLESKPPNYRAYEIFNRAKNLYLKDPNDPQGIALVDEAIETDPSYFEPKLYKFLYYYNRGEYAVADSLLQPLLSYPGTDPKQELLLNIYEALLSGNHKKSHQYQQDEYVRMPFDLETNSNMMIQSLQLVNKPGEIDSVFAEINMEGWDLTNCSFCVERYKMKGMADIERGRYQEAIDLLEGFKSEKGYSVLKKVLLRAYIKSGDREAANSLLNTISLTSDRTDWTDIYLFAVKEFIIADQPDQANLLLEKLIPATDDLPSDISTLHLIRAESLFFSGAYQEAAILLESILSEFPSLYDQHAMLAITYHKMGEAGLAQERIDHLDSLRENYQFGEIDYGLAQYHAHLEDEENTIRFLLKAISSGHWYETSSFQNDPLLKSYYDTDGFRRILTFWH